MTPVLQSRTDSSGGDCVRACCAALLNLKLEEVPDWMAREDAMEEHPTGYQIWYLAMQQWLAGKGYAFVEIQLAAKTWFPLPFETFAIFVGERESLVRNPHPEPGDEGEMISAVCRHAIVGKCEGDSFYPIFDPVGTNPLTAFKDNKILAVCLLVPVDPALMLEMGRAMEKVIRLARQLPFGEIKDAILENSERVFGLAQIELPMQRDPHASRIITPNDKRTNGGIITP